MNQENKYLTILLLILLISICSCTKEFKLNLPDQNRLIVVNSFFTPDSLVKINISQSTDVYTVIPQFVKNATVRLFKDGQLLDTLMPLSDGYYSTSYFPEINHSYKIEVDIPEYDRLSGTTSIPKKVPVLSMKKKDYFARDEDGIYYSELRFNFHDPEKEKNFYEIKLEYLNSKGNINLLYPFSLYDKVLIEEGENNLYTNTLPFCDKLFNGKDYEMSVNYYPPKYCTENNYNCKIADEKYRLILHFRSVSEEYYLYKKKLIHHIEGQYNDFWDGFGNQVVMYSNVENGYGIVGAYNEFCDTLLPDTLAIQK